MDDDGAIIAAERRVIEAEAARAKQAALLETLTMEGLNAEHVERALSLAERALELTQARLHALRSMAKNV